MRDAVHHDSWMNAACLRTPRLVLVCLAIAGCAPVVRHPVDVRPNATLAEDERAVWAAVIGGPGDGAFGGLVVVDDTTTRVGSPPEAGWLQFADSTFPYEAILNSAVRSRDVVSLASVMGEVAGVHWITPDEKRRVFTGGGVREPDRFRELFPNANGLLSVSRVGFDAGRRYAAVQVGHWCGSLCGSGGYVLLRRDAHGAWVKTGGFTNVIS
jgi:hypothetical protein